MNVLLLGGTAEARRLAAALDRAAAVTVTSSLAGAVAVPLLPEGDVRIGGFGGVEGLAAWLRDHGTAAVVDATHPFSTRMTAAATAAADALGIPLLVLRRPGWTAGPGDRWHRVADAAAAATLLPSLGERAFLAMGSGGPAAFAHLPGWFLLRAIDPPTGPLPARHRLVIGRGPFTADAERALLREHRIEVLVCRDSGGDLTAAKLVAARELGLPVVMIDRPPAPPTVAAVETVDEAVAWLMATAGTAPAPRRDGRACLG
ncbi:MAG TPA: cobalt-precorrin-6A reductase [Pseudonocardia sp.]